MPNRALTFIFKESYIHILQHLSTKTNRKCSNIPRMFHSCSINSSNDRFANLPLRCIKQHLRFGGWFFYWNFLIDIYIHFLYTFHIHLFFSLIYIQLAFGKPYFFGEQPNMLFLYHLYLKQLLIFKISHHGLP